MLGMLMHHFAVSSILRPATNVGVHADELYRAWKFYLREVEHMALRSSNPAVTRQLIEG
jgi:hypothetical protein